MGYYKREILDMLGELSIVTSKFNFDLFTIIGLIWFSPVFVLMALTLVLFLVLAFPVVVIGELLDRY